MSDMKGVYDVLQYIRGKIEEYQKKLDTCCLSTDIIHELEIRKDELMQVLKYLEYWR